LLSISSKTEYKNLLKKSISVSGGQTSSVEYHNMDPWLGGYRTKESSLADGTSIFSNSVPAYTKYPDMASKVLDPDNKNMLTQEAMSYSSISGYVGDNTLNARITTWNDTWIYRDESGNETTESGIWRKHKSYVWKDDLNPERGTYVTTVGNNSAANNHFDWGQGIPTNENWQRASEITRYTHWSSPLETQDINDNYASTKMADNDTKVVANGNASFTEMFASGAEYDIDGVYLDQEIKGVQYRSTDNVHTGEYALKLTSGDKGFETVLKVNEHVKDNYKISVWVFKADTNVRVNINGVLTKFNGETVQAGNWTLFNHYQYLKNSTYNISISTIGSNCYVDDFRIHPIYSSMNTYVYDENTDELNYILDSNSMATKYVYDDAGRLCKLYKEVEADFPETDGGFKLINQYKYHYTGVNSSGCDCCEGQTQSANSAYAPLNVKSLNETDKGAYKRTFQTSVNGGSGNYTYEWRWLTDFESNTYSNYVTGSTKQEIPFAVKMCDIKANTYNKIWVVELKATDTSTGEVITQQENVEFSGCKFVLSDSEWADLEISTNYAGCNPFTTYTFRPFVIKPSHQDYTYEYQSFDHATNQWSSYNAITTSKNNFCTESFYAPSSSCKTEYALYQTIRYRVIDNQTGNIYQSNIMDVYLDCVDNPDDGIKLLNSEYHDKYNKFGQVVEKSNTGDIITTYNFTDTINNKK
jgi:hypothetical protein